MREVGKKVSKKSEYYRKVRIPKFRDRKGSQSFESENYIVAYLCETFANFALK